MSTCTKYIRCQARNLLNNQSYLRVRQAFSDIGLSLPVFQPRDFQAVTYEYYYHSTDRESYNASWVSPY